MEMIHCLAKFTEIILLQITLFILPAEVWVTEVHTGGDGSEEEID